MGVALVLASACSERDETVRVGDGVPDLTTTSMIALRPQPDSTAAAPPSGDAAGPAPTPAPGRPAQGPRNVSVRNDPSGFRLTLTVADAIRFQTESAITLELRYENRSGRILVVDSDPQVSFVIRDKSGADRWRDADCRAQGSTGPDDTPGYGLAPGETARTVGRYPFEDRFPRQQETFDAQRCKLPAGSYDVFGALEWCAADRPPESGPHPANTCTEGTTRILLSAPVSIELVDP